MFYFFNKIFVLIFFDDSVKHIYFLRCVLKNFIDGAADCLEQFALFLIKQKNKETYFAKKRISWITNFWWFRCQDLIIMSLVSHKKSYLVCVELSNLRILRNFYLFSSSCLCPVLAVSVLYFEKKLGKGCVSIRQFDTYQIALLMRNQGHKKRKE